MIAIFISQIGPDGIRINLRGPKSQKFCGGGGGACPQTPLNDALSRAIQSPPLYFLKRNPGMPKFELRITSCTSVLHSFNYHACIQVQLAAKTPKQVGKKFKDGKVSTAAVPRH